MAELTQTEIYKLVDVEYKKFLAACTLITQRNDCSVDVADAIYDMLSQCHDGMTDVRVIAKRSDDEADKKEARLDRAHEKFESAKLRM